MLYYAPEAFDEARGLGYATDERWRSYFAWRAAPLGSATAEVVNEIFYSFNSRMVRVNVPAVWHVAQTDRIMAARLRAVDRFYQRVLGDGINDPSLSDAADLARQAAETVITAGRPLDE